MKQNHRQSIGHAGETIAAKWLERHGYRITERNYRTPYGEIDIVAHQGDSIVLIEVKTRANTALGPPEISITPRKAEHMRHTAEYYYQQHPEESGDLRIDVITVQYQAKGEPIIDHFENAIQ